MRLFLSGVLFGCLLTSFFILYFLMFEPDMFLDLLPVKSVDMSNSVAVNEREKLAFDMTRPVLVEHSSGRRFVVRPNGEVFAVGRGDRRKSFGIITIKNVEE